MAQRAPQLAGHRRFVWFESERRRPTEYESYTIGQQSSPERWLDVGWPVSFDDDRPPFTDESTALKCERWQDYRDPAQVWQRPFVAQTNREQQTLAAMVPEELATGAAGIASAWRDKVLGTYYAAWPFVEYGQFLSLCYAVREALAETLTFAITFQATDKLRHQQDIVHLIFALEEASPGFSDEAARPAWMTDPILVPTRETIEKIYSSKDWAEMFVVLNLVFEPLVGDLAKNEFFAKNAAHNGDPVTPLILAGARRDSRRHLDTAKAFVTMMLEEPAHGAHNRQVIGDWLSTWTPPIVLAAQALRGLFSLDGIESTDFQEGYDRVFTAQRSLIAELGL